MANSQMADHEMEALKGAMNLAMQAWLGLPLDPQAVNQALAIRPQAVRRSGHFLKAAIQVEMVGGSLGDVWDGAFSTSMTTAVLVRLDTEAVIVGTMRC